MTKKIEIHIKDEIYERLKNESVKYNMDIQSYIPVMIEKYDTRKEHNHNYIEEKIKKPLKKILMDLDGLSGDDNNGLPNRVLLLPLKMYSKPLPKGFSKLIQYYKSKGWYNIESFYLITNGKSILGYLGLNISEEDAPYGRYLFIYGLNLYKEHQNSTNLNYIINFAKSIGRQGQCYSIDILFENTNLTYNQLKDMGFQIFTSTDIVKVKIDKELNSIDDNYLESKNITIEDIGEFLPIARTGPFKSLLSQWISRNEDIVVCSNIYKTESEEIKFIYIKEEKNINNTMYKHFTLLVDPKYIYYDKYLNKVYATLNSIIYKNMAENKGYVVSIPRDLNKNLNIYNEEDVLDSINWLRKNNT